MLRPLLCGASLALLVFLPPPTSAQTIDSLRGGFTFNWHGDPKDARCARVDDRLLALFKSKAYTCNLTVVTNTSSGKPARVCTKKGRGAEYLIFDSKPSCELERKTQSWNGD